MQLKILYTCERERGRCQRNELGPEHAAQGLNLVLVRTELSSGGARHELG